MSARGKRVFFCIGVAAVCSAKLHSGPRAAFGLPRARFYRFCAGNLSKSVSSSLVRFRLFVLPLQKIMSLEEPAPPVDPAGAIGNALPVPNPARRGPNTTKDADGNTIPPPAPVVAAPLPTAFVNTGTKSVRVFSFPSTLLDLIVSTALARPKFFSPVLFGPAPPPHSC